ncbi:MAG: pseudouridine synthase [Candidatus Saccharimonadales bacterium]
MRINKYIALASGLSRRNADLAIADGRVRLNRKIARLGDTITDQDAVYLDNNLLKLELGPKVVMRNKPVGYVCSRDGQGSKTVYDILPKTYQNLNCVGRLDKDSSGLILLTNDGDLANQLTHPRYGKAKVYVVKLDSILTAKNQKQIVQQGIKLEDGISKFHLRLLDEKNNCWQVKMTEGRNRQIRRTFAAVGNNVIELERVRFGNYYLDDLALGQHRLMAD